MKNKVNRFIAAILSLTLVLALSGSNMTVFATSGDDSDETQNELETAEETAAAKETEEKAAAATATEAKAKAAAVEKDAKKAELQSQLADVQAKKKEFEVEQAKIKTDLEATRKEKGEKQAAVSFIDSKIVNTQGTIAVLETEISLLEQDITIKLEDIDEKIAEYDANYAVFLDRVRAMYMYDSSTTIGLVLGTDNYIDFLTTNDNLNRIAAHDEELMKNLNAEREALEAEKKELETSQAALEVSSKEAQAKKTELAGARATAQAQVYEVADLEAQFAKNLADSVAQSKKMEAEINRIFEQIKLSDAAYVGGEMAWPAPGCPLITSYFGWRFGGKDYHTGIDLSGGAGGAHGKPVVAANDGKVVFVNYSHSPGVGYGMYIMVDHGGGITTLYAHLSSIGVSVGQEVTRGQQIGNVGTTGWSTGPHLHFEVQINKKAQNPLPYIQ